MGRDPAARSLGISMVEILIILLLIGIAVVALMRNQVFSLSQVAESSNRAQAMRLAQQVIARFKATGQANSGGDTVPGLNATYRRSWTAALQRNPNHYDVTVTVSWTDRRNATQNVTVTGQVFGQSLVGAGRLAAPYAGVVAVRTSSPVATGEEAPTEKSVSGEKGGSGYTRTISGSIVVSGSVNAEDAEIKISQGGDCSVGGGGYVCTVPNGWSGDISFTSKSGAAVSPATTSYSETTSNLTNQDVFLVKR
ncbi:MAG TPA: hypothetical protein VMB75_04000 [Rhodocyclaceae bacterium]|nr:hypothetical protein [Rhodocyclaceae bacterium]